MLRPWKPYPRPRRRLVGGRAPLSAAAAFSLLALALASCQRTPIATTPDDIAALVRDLLGADRPTLGRLSVDLGYLPCADPAIGVDVEVGRCVPLPPPGSRERNVLLGAFQQSRSQLAGDASIEALHTRALWQLVIGGVEKALTRAERLLDDALGRAPDDPSLLNDAAVVRLELARRGDPVRGVEALDLARRATDRRPGWAVAAFNAALAAGHVPLPAVAHGAWSSLLEADESAAPWAKEARAHRGALPSIDLDAAFAERSARPPASAAEAEALVRDFPHAAAAYLLETLLPDWSEAHRQGRTEDAAHLLTSADHLASAVARLQGDRVGAETIDRIRTDPAALARSIAALGEGRAMLRGSDLEPAAEALRSVMPSADPDPLFGWARAWLGLIAIYGGDHQTAQQLLEEAERHLDPARHPTLLGRVLWHRGLSLARRGLDAESVPTYRRAAELFARLGDHQSRAALESMIAEDLDALGRSRLAWETRLGALRVLSQRPRSTRFRNLLLTAADASVPIGQLASGQAFAREAVWRAEQGTHPIARSESWHRLATLLRANGRHAEARGAYERALGEAQAITDAAFRQYVAADIRLERTPLLPAAEAKSELDALLPIFTGLDLLNRRLATLLERSRWSERAGDPAGARADLDRALALLLAKNRSLDAAGGRVAHSQVVHRVFEDLIRWHADRGQPLEALALLECARLVPYLSVIDAEVGRLVASSCEPLIPHLRSVLAELPSDERWLVYQALEDRLLVWTVEDGTAVLRAEPIARSDLERAIDDTSDAIRTDEAGRLRQVSAFLWKALQLDAAVAEGAKNLFLVPDGTLGRLSFAALVDPASGSYLVERASVDQSASVILTHQRRHDPGTRPAEPTVRPLALIVADPAHDTELTGLPRLARAGDVVDQIRSLYPAHRVLLDRDATRDRVRADLERTSLFYFAGHAVADGVEPLASRLVLARSGDPPRQEVLTASDLLRLSFPRLGLAVLAACQTASSGTAASPAASLAGMASPFLLRSDATVVASIQNVDDDATAQLMHRFLAGLGRGLVPTDALRAAQLAMIRDPDPAWASPYAWAWFTAIR